MNNINNMEMKRQKLIELSQEVTSHIIKKHGSLRNQCGYGASELRKRARKSGIKLKLQGGLFNYGTEHNWCVDPETNEIYDPTAGQFIIGINGLQNEETSKFYLSLNDDEISDLQSLARSKGFIWSFSEGVSQIVFGYQVSIANQKIVDKFRFYYPDLTHVIARNTKDEVRKAKNGNTYAVIRNNVVEFHIDKMNVKKWKNDLNVTGPEVVSYIVFKNPNNSYYIRVVEQRLFVSKNGKTGVITKLGEQLKNIKINKKGMLYRTIKVKDGYFVNEIIDQHYFSLIKRFEELTSNNSD